MRTEAEIKEELERIRKAQNASPLSRSDDIRLAQMRRALQWIINWQEIPPTDYPFDNLKAFKKVWQPERRIHKRRESPFGRRITQRRTSS